MVQHLKDEVRERIIHAAITVFYEHSFSSATLRMIADQADLPVSNIYSYFKSKTTIFDAVVEPVYHHFRKVLSSEEALSKEGFSSLKAFHIEHSEFLMQLFESPKRMVILTDKSEGTRHAKAKEVLVNYLERHIRKGLCSPKKKQYEDILFHILASNFTESLLEIARHYKNREWAHEMLILVLQCHFEGTESLL